MELIGSPGCGSVIIEMALALSRLPHRLMDVPETGPGRERLLALNPLGQVPTLVLDDGTVMTESAAILMHLHALAPEAGLVQSGPAFLNRLIWLVAAVYPTFTYGDAPERWTLAGDASAALRSSTDAHRQRLFSSWEAQAGPGPFAAGDRLTALDLYLVVMWHWRPRAAWFAAQVPKLDSFAARAMEHPALVPILARHRRAWAEFARTGA